MLEAVLDGLIDSLKLLPFLFLTYLLMEYIEDKIEDKTRAVLNKSGAIGPLFGGLFGVIPQCGFSAAASSLYAARVITMGTLIAIYLSTSDEMLPILISQAVSPVIIGKILGLKALIGMLVGFIVDRFCKKAEMVDIHHFCEHENCECGHGILRPAIKHTVKIFVFILIITVVLNMVVRIVGLDSLSGSVLNRPVIGAVLSGLVGLIPNCGASVVITSLYLGGALSFGTMMAGLLVGAGVGVLVLLRVNENKKENLIIIGILYLSGVLAGILINLIGISL